MDEGEWEYYVYEESLDGYYHIDDLEDQHHGEEFFEDENLEDHVDHPEDHGENPPGQPESFEDKPERKARNGKP